MSEIKIHFLGTLSGTEPFENMHHCSFLITVCGKNYWFDAGENCAHRAYCDGVEVMDTAALFISHMDVDHTGGLVNLFAVFRKLKERYKKTLINNNTLELFMPRPELLDSFLQILTGRAPAADISFGINLHKVLDGKLFDDGKVSVFALHNRHLKETEKTGFHSFSYLVYAEGKKIVYSGDVADICELDPFTEGGCDLLIMETGHHSVQDVLEYARDKNVKMLRFNHHGREILNGRAQCEKTCAEFAKAHGMDIVICNDGRTDII